MNDQPFFKGQKETPRIYLFFQGAPDLKATARSQQKRIPQLGALLVPEGSPFTSGSFGLLEILLGLLGGLVPSDWLLLFRPDFNWTLPWFESGVGPSIILLGSEKPSTWKNESFKPQAELQIVWVLE